MYAPEDSASSPTTASTCKPYPIHTPCPHCDDTGTVVVRYEDGDIEHHDCTCVTQTDDPPSFIDPSIFEPDENDFDARIEAILCGADDGEDWSFITSRPVELSEETRVGYNLDDVPNFSVLAA